MSWQGSRHLQSAFKQSRGDTEFMSLPVLTFAQKFSNSLVSACKEEFSLSSPQCCLIRLNRRNWPHQYPPLFKYCLCLSQKESWSLNCVFYALCGAIHTFFWSPDKYENCCFETAPTNPLPVAACGAHQASSFMKTPIISRRLCFLSPTYTTGILIWTIEPDRSLLLQHCFRILGSN